MGYDKDYFNRDVPEFWFKKHGLLRPDQLFCLCMTFNWPWNRSHTNGRKPKFVVSMGCGEGHLEEKLEEMGVNVTGVDPQPIAKEIYLGSVLKEKFSEQEAKADTLIFCESIEHIPAEETRRVINSLGKGSRVIVANWQDFHPIEAVDWDHMTRIDDDFYDDLTAGHKTIYRKGSHLVFEL